ncbi:hypothetical protein, partial [Streptomyces sp900116325]|uniref:hypothetical protein n=1 Tax=Streptomyces sp. 900116325 TaxID=3154295 RepID=UPI0033DB4675
MSRVLLARTTTSERCRNPQEYGQTGTRTPHRVTGFEVYHVGDSQRWSDQHSQGGLDFSVGPTATTAR